MKNFPGSGVVEKFATLTAGNGKREVGAQGGENLFGGLLERSVTASVGRGLPMLVPQGPAAPK